MRGLVVKTFGSQAPIFRRNPELNPDNPRSLVMPEVEFSNAGAIMPLGVFVARRSSFECFVSSELVGPQIIDAIFDALPLEENGWNRGDTAFEIVRDIPGGTIWRISLLNTIRPSSPSIGRDRATTDGIPPAAYRSSAAIHGAAE